MQLKVGTQFYLAVIYGNGPTQSHIFDSPEQLKSRVDRLLDEYERNFDRGTRVKFYVAQITSEGILTSESTSPLPVRHMGVFSIGHEPERKLFEDEKPKVHEPGYEWDPWADNSPL